MMNTISPQEILTGGFVVVFGTAILAGSFFLERLRKNIQDLAPDYYEKIGGNRKFLRLIRGDPLYNRIQTSIPDDFPENPILRADAIRVRNIIRVLIGIIICMLSGASIASFIKHY